MLDKMDEGYKMMFKAFVFNGLPYSTVKKLTKKQMLSVFREVKKQYSSYLVNPGEFVGPQCSQGFCRLVT